jgi:hypothetical protein
MERSMGLMAELRIAYHRRIYEEIVRLQRDGETRYPNFAVKGSKASFALPELRESIVDAGNEDQLDMLMTLIDGRRLRDISDLPFDLAT